MTHEQALRELIAIQQQRAALDARQGQIVAWNYETEINKLNQLLRGGENGSPAEKPVG